MPAIRRAVAKKRGQSQFPGKSNDSPAFNEPYGQVLVGGIADRPGFTGHVADAQTGMDYMQQRYYDPLVQRFLSVDPVTAYDKPMTNFNRYAYASDNPYKFTDPDGRQQQITPQFFQDQGYPKSMGETQQRAAANAAFVQSQSPHAVAERLDNVEAGLTATSLAITPTPLAPAAPFVEGVALTVGSAAYLVEPSPERGLNVAMGGALKILKNIFKEGSLAKQAVETVETSKDLGSVANTAEKNMNDSTISPTVQPPPPPPQIPREK